MLLENLLQERVRHGPNALEFFLFGNFIVGMSMTRTGCFGNLILQGQVQNGRNSLESFMQTGCLRNLFFRDEYDTDGVRLFRVRGAGEGQVDFRAEQVRVFSYHMKRNFYTDFRDI